MGKFKFELVSPEKMLISRDVTMVTVPGGKGDYSVLKGHTLMITNVRPGVIVIYDDNDHDVGERVFVSGGFAEVTEERCTVLAEEAIPLTALNRAEIEEEVKNLTEDLGMVGSDAELKAVETKLALASAKLAAAA